MNRSIALILCMGFALCACQSNADGDPDAAAAPDIALDAEPADASPTDMLVDADPRSLVDLWAPDFGPPPDDMPEEIRWMHGRMWCDDPRPPRVLADGSSECDYQGVDTPVEWQTSEPVSEFTIGCTVWPYRTSEFVGAPGGEAAAETWVTCNPEGTLCCSFIEIGQPVPCGWRVDYAHNRHYSGEEWVADQGRIASIIDSGGFAPPELVDAFPQILNNCHPICKPPTCPGD